MNVTINRCPVKTKQNHKKELFDFGEKIGAELVVNERSPIYRKKGTRYYAYFKELHIISGDLIITTFGDGDTINEAIKDYSKRISGQQIRYVNMKEFTAPILFYKSRKEYNK